MVAVKFAAKEENASKNYAAKIKMIMGMSEKCIALHKSKVCERCVKSADGFLVCSNHVNRDEKQQQPKHTKNIVDCSQVAIRIRKYFANEYHINDLKTVSKHRKTLNSHRKYYEPLDCCIAMYKVQTVDGVSS